MRLGILIRGNLDHLAESIDEGQLLDRKPVAAVLLADEQRAVALAQVLEQEQFRPLVLSSTDDFHQAINRECVDLVVIEDRLRGFLTGVEVLERMYRDLVKPVTILLSAPSAEIERRVRALEVNRLLPCNVPLEELASAAKSLVSDQLRDGVHIPPQARTLVQQAGFIRPLPQILIQMSEYLGRDDDHAAENLARDIAVDARLSAELLKLTNSSAMGRPFKTTNVFEAVRYLGVRRTVATVLSAGLFRAQAPLLDSLSPQVRNWYQYRSVLIGNTASGFATALEDVSPPTAYLLGLLQDIGTLVLGHVYGRRYEQMLDRVKEIPHLRRNQVELKEFEVDHAQVSAALLQKWELPPSLVSLVLRHHESDYGVNRPDIEQAFLRVMRIGEHVADVADTADVRSPKRFLDLNEALSFYGKAKSSECKAALKAAVDQSVASSRLFSIPSPDEKAVASLADELAARCMLADLPPQRGKQADAVERLTEPRNDSQSAAAVARSAANRRFTLLVVEDDPVATTLIRHFVGDYPIDVLECSHPEDVPLLAGAADVIACDVHLGAVEGTDIIRSLRDSGFDGHVIMMSVDNSRSTVLECIELRIDAFLAKPFSRDRFMEKVSRVLPLSGAHSVPNTPFAPQLA